jgi:hypothetical protein
MDCKKSGGISGGEAFGIFLLVVLLVGIVGGAAVMVFLKVKKPETYDRVVNKVKSTASAGVNKVKGLSGKGGSSAPANTA